MRLDKKWIKTSLLYVIVLILLIEIIKIRPKKEKNNTIVENYKNYEKDQAIKLEEEIEDFSKQQKYLKANLNNHTKYLKIKHINFADSSYSKKIFTISSYLNSMNKVNLYSRNFETIEDAKIKYINHSLVDITDHEKEAFLWLIETLLEKVKHNTIIYNFVKYFVFDDNNHNKIIIAKSAEWLEYNMPHTHNNVIILTSKWFNDIIKKYKKDLVESSLLNEGMTFIHELIHTHQRTKMNIYEELYGKWGFINATYIHNIKEYIYMNRLNPDGEKLDWIWNINNKYYLIGALFDSEKPNSLISVSYKLYELNKTDNKVFNYVSNNINNNNKGISLTSSELFMDYFGIINNHYHPNEITAQYMEYYLSDILGYSSLGNEYKGYNIFKSHIKKMLYI